MIQRCLTMQQWREVNEDYVRRRFLEGPMMCSCVYVWAWMWSKLADRFDSAEVENRGEGTVIRNSEG